MSDTPLLPFEAAFLQWKTERDAQPELFSHEYDRFYSHGQTTRVTSMDVYLPVRDDGYVETLGMVRHIGEENPLADGWRWMKATIQFADLKELR